MEEPNQLTLTRKTARRFLYGSLATFGVFSLAFLLLPYFLSEASATTDVSFGANWSPVSLTLDPDYSATQSGTSHIGDLGHGDIDFGLVNPSSATSSNIGTQRVVKKTIGIESSGQYYTVYLSMSGSSNSLAVDSDSNIYLPATGGTWSAPSSFATASWGYAVPGTSIPKSSSDSSTPFSTSYSAYDSYIGQDLTASGIGSSVYNTNTWAAVPTNTSAQQIWKASTSDPDGFGGDSGDTTNDHFSVYYSVMVDTSVMAGDYTNSLVYTALASAVSLDTASTNLSRSERFVAAGDQETLTFDLSVSTAGLIDRSDLKVYLVPHSDLLAANYSITSTLESNKSSYKTCTIGSDPSDFSITSSGASLNCTLPASAIEGHADGAGSYDFWINIDRYNLNFFSRYTENSSIVASIVYAGLQSTSDSAGTTPLVQTMQQMSASICQNTNIWGKGTGTNAKVYTYDTTDLATTNNVSDPSDPDYNGLLASVAHDNDYLMNIGTFALVDARDNKDYLVRRLADNNCWMVQNLDLNLGTVGTLTAENTDLNSKTTWNPVTGLSTPNNEYSSQTQYASGYQRGSNNYWGSRYNEYIDNDTKTYISNFDPTTNGGSLITADKDANDKFANRSFYPNGIRNDTATANGSLIIENNSRTQFPRAYDNGETAMVAFYRVSDGAGNNDIMTYYHKPWESSAVNFSTQSTKYGAAFYNDQSGTSTTVNTTTAIDGTTSISVTDWLDYSPTRDSSKYGTMYIGDYYNWYAATAQSGTFAMNSTSYVAQDSICPKGWRLPVDANTSGSWVNLLSGSYFTSGESSYIRAREMHLSPLSIPFSGNYYWLLGNLSRRGSDGYFWSATANSYRYARSLNPAPTGISTQYNANKTGGFTIRCVAR